LARELLKKEKREAILAMPDPWMATNMAINQKNEPALWWAYLIYENNIDEEDKGGEQLVVRDQVICICPCCDKTVSWI